MAANRHTILTSISLDVESARYLDTLVALEQRRPQHPDRPRATRSSILRRLIARARAAEGALLSLTSAST